MHNDRQPPLYQAPPDDGQWLIHADAHLIVANKPAGLLAVPGRGTDKQDCLASRIQGSFPDALVVHRLDMETSGLILLARSADMQSRLSRLFQQRQINKTYEALVSGTLSPLEGEIDLPLICDWPNRPRQIVDFASGKPALTRYRVIGECADSHSTHSTQTTRVALYPVTGRSHQLRVHLLSIGHPILGDRLYGGVTASRLMLHASALEFTHPVSGGRISFELPPPF